MSNYKLYILVAIGGAAGASLRFLLSEFIFSVLGRGFPYATLFVNVLGSFIMGLLYGAVQQEYLVIIPWRTLLSIGFLGALTTFSTFSLDTLLMLQQGDWIKAAVNVTANVMLCLFFAWVGMQLIPTRAGGI